MKKIIALGMVSAWFGTGVFVGLHFRSTAQAVEPCALIEPTPIDSQMWLYRGLDACDAKCGKGIPFDVEVEPNRVRCNCGRPPNLGVKKP